MSFSYRLPAEWEPQSGVLITWPHKHSDWVNSLAEIESFFLQLAKSILKYEKLLIIAYDSSHKQHISNALHEADINDRNVIIYCAETNDTWTRDYGPIGLYDSSGNIKLMDFTFNAWGNKFDSEKDNLVSRALLKDHVINANESESLGFVLEGGSIDSDGRGTLLTTKQCLFNKNRNPDLSEEEIAELIQNKLNANNLLWISEGMIAGDDTDSHIDMLARFTDPATIVFAFCEDENDEHFQPLLAMKQQIEQFRKTDGTPYTLKALPIPAAIYNEDGDRLPASYANFLIINNAVLLPVYEDKNDNIAINVLQDCFPDREIIPINARAAIAQGGSLHCLTMQLISGVLN